MTIREKGYHRWEGQLDQPRFRWLPMFRVGITNVIKKKFAKSLLSFACIPFIVFMFGIYISTKPELQMMQEVVRLLQDQGKFFTEFAGNGFVSFILFLLAVFMGAELISGDIRFNSFPLYFSRPLDRRDYIIGKFSIIMFYFLLVTLVPNVLLFLLKMVFTGELMWEPRIFLGLIVTPVLFSGYVASVTLLVSSFSGNTRYTQVIVFLIYLFSNLLAELLRGVTKEPLFYLISFNKNLRQMSAFLFGTSPRYDSPPWLSLVVVLLVIGGSLYILNKRITRAEAQIDNSN